jgi:hypothetical protein
VSSPTGAAGRGPKAPGLDLSVGHISAYTALTEEWSATKVIPSPYGDDSETPGGPEAGSRRPGGEAGAVDQRDGGAVPARLHRRPDPPSHAVIRRIFGSSASWRVRRWGPSRPPCSCSTVSDDDASCDDQAAGQPVGPLPLRGEERSRLPDQVEALPRGREARLEAVWLRMMQRPFPGLPSASAWPAAPWGTLMDLACTGDVSTVGGAVTPTWSSPLRRVVLLVGAKGLEAEWQLRRLWTTAVDRLGATYTLGSVPEERDRGGAL